MRLGNISVREKVINEKIRREAKKTLKR